MTQRGGKRVGAGRPPTIGATERATVTLTPEDRAYLLRLSVNLSEAIRLLIARDRERES